MNIPNVDEDYVTIKDSFEDNEFLFSEKYKEMGWTKVLPPETLGEFSSGNKEKVPTHMDYEECGDYDHLCTPHESDNDKEVVKFTTYKSRDAMKFHLRMMFTNKEVIRDFIKDYGIEKKVLIKKNDPKRMVLQRMVGCKFYMRLNKRNEHKYWQIVRFIDEYTC